VIAAVSWVALRNVVGRGEPFQFTTESLVKVVPFEAVTVRVKPAGLQYGVLFADVVDAESEAMLSAEIVKEVGLVVPPPGEGVNTVTGTEPAAERSDARTGMLSCVGPR
jgi:hypothetical protein